ncbi:alpha-1,2-fucosyltransferase [Pisciglobus halotolerans]|uniref:Glycosyl transferase family 11 n=1 Tax=Pisciglobus halotolerans TaxID=745365 RepID=A0A1I3DKP6_9LACT|nr:alpha-1,2-fucosyltransferase [Pisciglobus halotolerans]SFH87266.1 Glycosyl transferase family 11 [Pisciglobus halotolerans]
MIYTRITSGLGNQMFQYAIAYSYSRKYDMPLILDLTNFKISKKRTYQLDKFKLNDYKKITFKNAPLEIKIFWLVEVLNMISIKLRKKEMKRKNNYNLKSTQFICEKYKEKYNINFDLTNKSLYLSGFWQSPLYFENYRDELIQQFSPNYVLSNKLKEYETKIINCRSVSVHIRRGDFLQHGLFKDVDYQKKAITYLEKKLDNPIFFFFSDDIEWTKEKFKNQKNCFFVSSDSKNSGIEEMYLMSKCENNIIANSTFSWWGAWLNQNQNKIVIAPSTGFGNKDILPKSWYTI